MKRNAIAVLALLIPFALIAAGCGSGQDAGTETQDADIVAEVGDWTLTRDDLERILDQLSEAERQQYDSEGGRVELVDRALGAHLYYLEALAEGLDRDEDVVKLVKEYEKQLLVDTYQQKYVRPMAYGTEEEMYEYYEANPDRFTKKAIVRAQHILCESREEAELRRKMIVEDGEPMTTIAHKYSRDLHTKDAGGDLGYFNRGGYLKGLGYNSVLSRVAFTLELGEISEPIEWERGWSIMRVNEIHPEELKPFEDVKDNINEILYARRKDEVQAEMYEKLADKYNARNVLAEKLNLSQRTPEELWNLAQTSTDSYHRLRNYKEIVDRFPKSEHAPNALFMIGFVNVEELNNTPEADRAFTRVVRDYPDSEVAASARWMLDNMHKPHPRFEDIDDLKDAMSKDAGN